jgi:hypothetical protein
MASLETTGAVLRPLKLAAGNGMGKHNRTGYKQDEMKNVYNINHL